MNVLSLFDGMSCGQQALDRLGIKVDNYFASEIDKYAIQVTMANYPNTIQLGSVVNVDGHKLPKIDLLLGGSPCQSFSFAGKRKGMSTKDEQEILTLEHYLELKADGFEFEGQSYLFWEYMRLLNECKPTYFLLENVEMGEKWEKVLSKAIGVNGIHINSALVSAQNRKRIYWTNIGLEPSGLFGDLESIITQPKDKGILLKDVLQDNPNSIYYLSDKMVNYVSKSGTKNFYYKPEFANLEGKAKPIVTKHIYRSGTTNYIDEKYFLSEKLLNYFYRNDIDCKEKGTGFRFTPLINDEIKSKTITQKEGTQMQNNFIVHNTMPRSSTTGKGGTGQLSRTDGKTYCLDTGSTNAIEYKSRIRRLTPIECERLQTVADNYTNHVSDSQRYKMLGNGWTIEVIAHILKFAKF